MDYRQKTKLRSLEEAGKELVSLVEESEDDTMSQNKHENQIEEHDNNISDPDLHADDANYRMANTPDNTRKSDGHCSSAVALGSKANSDINVSRSLCFMRDNYFL